MGPEPIKPLLPETTGRIWEMTLSSSYQAPLINQIISNPERQITLAEARGRPDEEPKVLKQAKFPAIFPHQANHPSAKHRESFQQMMH